MKTAEEEKKKVTCTTVRKAGIRKRTIVDANGRDLLIELIVKRNSFSKALLYTFVDSLWKFWPLRIIREFSRYTEDDNERNMQIFLNGVVLKQNGVCDKKTQDIPFLFKPLLHSEIWGLKGISPFLHSISIF